MEITKKINFKQPKYIIPLIVLPVLLFVGYQFIDLLNGDDKTKQAQQEISTSLGKVEAPILSKNKAYDNLFNDENNDGRTMIQGFDNENDSLYAYTDNLNEQQKRYLDSIEYVQKNGLNQNQSAKVKESYYKPNTNVQRQQDDEDFNRSMEMMRMLNEGNKSDEPKQEEKEYDPVKGLREQMLFLDSLEKSKDPTYKRQMEAQGRMKANKDKMDEFLNSTMRVSKTRNLGAFNHISKQKENFTIKSVIDENIKGYLGSRIRLRLLEDIFIGKKKVQVKKGTFLYAEISGFSQQRVFLNIVSVMVDNDIYPINLSIYDMDGMKGLYVPSSAFREMTRELGANSIQGVNVESGQGFFTSMASNLFRSASEAVTAIIRKNKVTLKYNSYIYLIDEKDLKKKDENEE
ncbi:conjugative transposon protein TraM [uncultured Capnocytophaga sp.]|jgi:conserved protein found in conjugate transposon traM|uniref:conjugative transposon protein TraM n=1 Tax=uncultured Capnocytophaga sp. TaxID=159273 RepID=UPI0026293DC4|nr:conjugative transposon protein TraM [uncultured Capnocytophaga sp.]